MVVVKRLQVSLFALCLAVVACAMPKQDRTNEFSAKRAIEEFYNINKERIVANYRAMFPYLFSLEESGADADRWMQEYSGNESSMENMGEEYETGLELSIKTYFINRANFAANRQRSINKVSAEELRRLLFLTEFQIRNLIEYRERSGLILSVKELSSVKGFNDYMANFCAVLFSFPNEEADLYNIVYTAAENKKTYGAHRCFGWESQLRYSPQKYMRLRQKAAYSFRSRANISAGIFCENDAGEGGRYFRKLWSGNAKEMAANMAYKEAAEMLHGKIPPADFISFNLSADNIDIKNLKFKFVAGDFRAGFGYGLILRQGLNFTNYMQPISFVSNGNGVMTYNGSDENDYFRGFAFSAFASKHNISVSLFYSNKAVDARIKDGGYSTLLKDGKHNTPSLFDTRKTLKETVCGANISKEWNRARAGITAVISSFNLPYSGKLNYYNGYRYYEGPSFNIGINWLYSLGSAMIFGEAACSVNMGKEKESGEFYTAESEKIAVLCGVYLRIGDNIEVTFGLRHYGVSYIAPYSGAYSTLGEIYNQRGAFVSLFKPVFSSVKLGLFADYTLYPYPRYRLPYKTSSFKVMAGLENYSGIYRFNWNLRGVVSSTPFKTKLYLKGMGRYNLGSLSFTGRGVAGVKYGAAQLNADYMSAGKNLRITAGAMFYNVNDWENRIYMYEATLPGTYGGRLLYKKGFAGYLYLMAKPFKWCKLYFKYSAPKGYTMFGADLTFK